jgi:hypothetical protein
LSKKEGIQVMPPHTKSVQFELLQIKRITIMDLRTIKTEGSKPLLDAIQLVGIR